ncbi:hypothetical protein HY968_01215 [Candidatus Kaiserbacteria bacterium]|nr:hypothetical protein [Candidatus Kaiserbacteria bacterium]
MHQKGFSNVALILILAVFIVGGAIEYTILKKNASYDQWGPSFEVSSLPLEPKAPAKLPAPVPDSPQMPSAALTAKDILGATYMIGYGKPFSADSARSIVFPSPVQNNGLLTGTVAIKNELFWIYKYEFTDAAHTQATVYIGGNFGASASDDRTFVVTRTGGKVTTKETQYVSRVVEQTGSASVWKTYSDSRYAFSFAYPSDWKIEQTEFGASASKEMPDGSRLMLGIAKVGQFSYDPQKDTKGTFLGKEAYFKTFDGCSAEGGASQSECYLKIAHVIIGTKQVNNQTYQQDITADSREITYGVAKTFSMPVGSTHTSNQAAIMAVFDQNKALFDELMQKIEL